MNPNTLTSSDEGDINCVSLQASLEEKSGTKVLEFFDTQKPKISVEALDIALEDDDYELFSNTFGISLQDFSQELHTEYVGEDIIYQLVYTWKYLQEKYEKSREKLNVYGISPKEITDACMKRLLSQIQEASKNGRKLINGRVASLLKSENNTLYMQEIPYYAFASSNVSLDDVNIGERTLRDVVNLCNNTNDVGEFMLPNSLGICISVMAKDEQGKPCIIAQDRNNTTTLTQRTQNKVVASASGAINISNRNANLEQAAREEVSEELGLTSNVHYLPQAANTLFTGELNPIQRELGISQEECDFEPRGLVMEKKRMNPEIVCSGYTNKSLPEIIKLWEAAESKDESHSIKGISLQEIGDNLSGEKETLGKHFLMSLLAWYGSPQKDEILKNS